MRRFKPRNVVATVRC